MSGYCGWCDTIIPDEAIIRAFDDSHRMVWTGCLSCYNTRNELKQKRREVIKKE